jgi:hypothetical protein
MLRVILLVLCVAIGAGAFLLIRDGTQRPNVPQLVELVREGIRDDARTAAARKVDGLGFPDWRRYGWNARGGRLDRLEDDREAATVFYARGAESISYTIVSGTGNVDDETITVSRQLQVPGGKVEIALAQTGDYATLKRKRQGRTILMTGASPNDQLLRAMRRLAVRGVSPQPG